MSRRTIVSTLAAAVLSAAIAGPALADPPTFSGHLWCTRSGEVTDMGFFSGLTRKQIAEEKKRWTDNGFCDRNAVYVTDVTKDA